MASKVTLEAAGAAGVAANVPKESHELRRAVGSGDHIPGDMLTLGPMCMSHSALSWQQLKERQMSPFFLQVSSMSWLASPIQS